MDFDYFFTNYGFSVSNFLSGKYYTAITSIFLHANIWHLVANMVALWLLGTAVESKVKSWQYFLVYFLGGILGNLLMFPLIFIPFFDSTAVPKSHKATILATRCQIFACKKIEVIAV
jgi:membrane associated rhomboid family serine protease